MVSLFRKEKDQLVTGEASHVFPCDGEMHLTMSLFSGIGVLYGDAGIRNLLKESGVDAAGTVSQMLSGKDFKRAL